MTTTATTSAARGTPAPRRSALLVAAAVVVTLVGLLGVADVVTATPAPSAAAPHVAAAAALPSIDAAADATFPARRLRRPGIIMFPMEPTPRCAILDNFGDPRSGGRHHEGADLLATLGQKVYAVVDGTLTRQADATASLSGNAWGLTSDFDSTYYFYAHLSAFAAGLSLGDHVREGDLIGYVGDTGNPGPGNYHLHFEIHPGGQANAAVNPLPLMDIPGSCTIT